MIDLQDIITTKRELLSRETYSRTPINYSEDMAADQKRPIHSIPCRAESGTQADK